MFSNIRLYFSKTKFNFLFQYHKIITNAISQTATDIVFDSFPLHDRLKLFIFSFCICKISISHSLSDSISISFVSMRYSQLRLFLTLLPNIDTIYFFCFYFASFHLSRCLINEYLKYEILYLKLNITSNLDPDYKSSLQYIVLF